MYSCEQRPHRRLLWLVPKRSKKNNPAATSIIRGHKSALVSLYKERNMQLESDINLLLQWNLIARATNVASVMMEHISWEADALLITLPELKGDQEGTNSVARHLYANAADPVICPVLALAIVRVLRSDPDSSISSTDSALPNYRIVPSELSSLCIFRRLNHVHTQTASSIGSNWIPLLCLSFPTLRNT